MDQVPSPDKDNSPVVAPPAVPRGKSHFFSGRLNRTTFGFTAEYSIFLIALGVVLSNLAGLVYIFCALIVDTMHGGVASSFVPANLFTLWLLISSVVALPTVVVLWARIKGELAAQAGADGDLPKGAAKGFRTFWLIVSIITIIGLKMAALYAPIAAAVSGGPVAEVLLSVTLPSLLNAAILVAGVYLVTRRTRQQNRGRLLLWGVALATALLFTVDYLWAHNMQQNAPPRTTSPFTSPSDNYDIYQDMYNDTYYDYGDESPYQ